MYLVAFLLLRSCCPPSSVSDEAQTKGKKREKKRLTWVDWEDFCWDPALFFFLAICFFWAKAAAGAVKEAETEEEAGRSLAGSSVDPPAPIFLFFAGGGLTLAEGSSIRPLCLLSSGSLFASPFLSSSTPLARPQRRERRKE